MVYLPIGFDSDPRLYDLEPSCTSLEFSTLYSSSLCTNNTIVFSKLSSPPLSNNPPVSIKPSLKWA